MRVYRCQFTSYCFTIATSTVNILSSVLLLLLLVPRAHVNDEPDDKAEKSGHSNHDYEPGDVLEEVFPLPIEEQLVAVAV